MNPPKISAAQLAILLFLARLMHTMIFRVTDFDSGTPIMLGLAASTLIEALLMIPAAVYASKSIRGEAALPKPVRLLYSLYFTVIAGGTAALFAEFLHREFSGTVPPTAAIILIALAAGYCAYAGIEGIARAGAVVFILFAALFLSMVAVSEGEFNWLNLRPMTRDGLPHFSKYLFESLSSSWQIPMLVLLGSKLRRNPAGAAYGFLALKFLAIETLLLLITLVLWRYVGVLGYPIYALGAFAKSDFIQRFDPINMLVWAINCTLVSALYICISSEPVKSRSKGAVIFSALAAAFALYEYKRGLRYDETWFLVFKLLGVLILGTVVPLCAMAINKFKSGKGALTA